MHFFLLFSLYKIIENALLQSQLSVPPPPPLVDRFQTKIVAHGCCTVTAKNSLVDNKCMHGQYTVDPQKCTCNYFSKGTQRDAIARLVTIGNPATIAQPCISSWLEMFDMHACQLFVITNVVYLRNDLKWLANGGNSSGKRGGKL